MTRVVWLAWALLVALTSGLGSAAWMIGPAEPLGAVSSGPWTAWPMAADPTADPYTRAMIARTGRPALGVAEGFEFFAQADQTSRPLEGSCRYRLEGPIAKARLWTLAAYTTGGELVANPAGRSFLTSRLVVRDTEARLAVHASADAQPGNWLPVPRGRFTLVLRLYDTTLSMGSAPADIELPTIIAEGC